MLPFMPGVMCIKNYVTRYMNMQDASIVQIFLSDLNVSLNIILVVA